MKPFLRILLIAGLAAALLPPAESSASYFTQGKGKDKKAEPAKGSGKGAVAKGEAGEGGEEEADRPAPLMTGKVGLKSSRQSKDQATLGFNGIGPDGKVSAAELAAVQPTSTDILATQALIAYRPTDEELAAFVKEGELTEKADPPPDESKDKKKKR